MITKKVLGIILGGVLMSENCGNAQSVHIEIVPGRSAEYTSLETFDQAKSFAINLSKAKEDQIQIDDESSSQKIETAVRIVVENTVKNWGPNFDTGGSFTSVPDDKKPMLAAFLWKIQEELLMHSVNSALYCLNRLHEIASSDFDKAQFLLLSQCENNSISPSSTADWDIIGDAVLMLRREKNGHAVDAQVLLGQLKKSGHYSALLGDWTD